MRKLQLLGIVFTTFAIGPALAADLGMGERPAPPPVFSWTGFYVGGNVGYSWGRSENDITVTGLPPFLFGLSTASLARGDRDDTDVDGVIGGGQTGFNWQVGNWVLGTESDLQGSGQKGDTQYCGLGGTTCAIASLNASHKLSWFGTARSRLGYLVTPTLLLYGTAGVAYGQVKSNYTLNVLNTPLAAVNFKDVKAGWTAGAGLEFAFTGNWSTKVEYLYMDLGENEIAFSAGAVAGTLQRQFTDHIARVGVNYRFGAVPF
jgi:outer membrane immunogenic protein